MPSSVSRVVVSLFALAGVATGQLRPKRVGTNAMGDQEVVYSDVPSNGGGGGAEDPMAAMRQAMAGMGGGDGGDPMAAMQQMMAAMGGEGGLDLGEMMRNNPMLSGLADANPEVAEMLNNPEKMKEQMAQVAQLMGSSEGQNMMANMVQQMQEVMTDPEKLKEGLEQFATNPALAGFADKIPGMREMLENPDELAAQAEKVAEVMQAMGDPEKAAELLGPDGANVRGALHMPQAAANLMQGRSHLLGRQPPCRHSRHHDGRSERLLGLPAWAFSHGSFFSAVSVTTCCLP